ncbi:hypothetical protein G8A07_15235 [Roseateles sp. DAIF2]|uniref:hypothetical protein n=1 Tax=Roseateles sp. DAIF2 TaxID=2714952 RepID=UPI0018A313C6|nr:hypothetical protein [Roseateles sp. DAIF2]QPF74133.1 hypothetical protein G8A07_15235 [Roseateles sp. DAIF2]
MTSKLWRLMLAWLLAMALPLQGYAAHALMLCGPAHHQSPLVTTQAHATMDHQGHEGHDSAEHGAQHHATPDSGDEEQAQPGGHAGACSVCASCCNAAALVTSLPVADFLPPAPVAVATVPVAHARVLTGGLERPPRTDLV